MESTTTEEGFCVIYCIPNALSFGRLKADAMGNNILDVEICYSF